MEMDTLLTLIGSYGFPIIMCIIVCLYVKYITDKNNEQISELNQQHRNEVLEMTKAIENNTLAITRLVDKLED